MNTKPCVREGESLLTIADRRARIGTAIVLALFVVTSAIGSPFATRVVEYAPAPGQFVRNASFNNPGVALGAPAGGGIAAPSATSVVTLGGFGGSITLAFDHPVEDDGMNPFGVDAIVFGNAFAPGSDLNRRWAECAVIEISQDVNGNGEADDPWYLIPGSHIDDPVGQWLVATWDNNVADETYPPAISSWIPPGRFGIWSTGSFELPADLFGTPVVINPSGDSGIEGIFGYADYTPTLQLGDTDADNVVDEPGMPPEEFYVVPDDPLTTGFTPGSGGGDAFDVAWAIDPDTGLGAELRAFDFIRITTAVHVVSDLLGEKSAEVDAVADVRADPLGDYDNDHDIDLADVAGMQLCFEGDMTWEGCDRLDRQPDGIVDWADVAAMVQRLIGPGSWGEGS